MKAAWVAVADCQYCSRSRLLWGAALAIALVIEFSRQLAPGLPSTVITLLGHGVAVALANLVLAYRQQSKLAFARRFDLAQLLPQQCTVLLAAVTIYLAVLAITLWPDWAWLPLLATQFSMVFLYIGLGVIPAALLRRRAMPPVVNYLQGFVLGALPVIGLVLAEHGLQTVLWHFTAWPFAHNLLSICAAVCSGAVYFGIEKQWG